MSNILYIPHSLLSALSIEAASVNAFPYSMSSVRSIASSNGIDVGPRSISPNLIVPLPFPLKACSNGDSTRPAPSLPGTEGRSNNDADTPRAEDLISHYHHLGAPSMRLFLAYIPPYAFTTHSADVFLHNLKGSPHAQESKIVTVKRFVKKNATRHRFLVLLIARDGMPAFSLRIDRSRDHTLPLLQFVLCHGKSDAADTVTVSGPTHLLFDGRSKEESMLKLPLPVSLLEFMRILEVVLDECHSYKLFGENCWFVAWILEELLVDMFGARYATGEAMHLHFARKTRTRIRNRLELVENV
ncbi:uncharacterized protein EI90DRAFT_3056112 [Cantharellus anzutake]|uniref:uncharacterized protein n=1 Tax=Cantharellus anzutake TaxID=1750568 RepID=UPI001904AB3B|nr:uncharacterized protein EI90DRAFT_3056112 [Cantharellus anzutake]KAF8331974.1 hypothetical protein EI90DRAFT_3056112 [Cantharellus anzutake]